MNLYMKIFPTYVLAWKFEKTPFPNFFYKNVIEFKCFPLGNLIPNHHISNWSICRVSFHVNDSGNISLFSSVNIVTWICMMAFSNQRHFHRWYYILTLGGGIQFSQFRNETQEGPMWYRFNKRKSVFSSSLILWKFSLLHTLDNW